MPHRYQTDRLDTRCVSQSAVLVPLGTENTVGSQRGILETLEMVYHTVSGRGKNEETSI